MDSNFKEKLDKLKQAKLVNRVKFRWQDAVLYTMEEFGLPRVLHSDKSKIPLNVTGILMRHAKKDLSLFTRRFGLIKEKGLAGASAFMYFLGIVEGENEKEKK